MLDVALSLHLPRRSATYYLAKVLIAVHPFTVSSFERAFGPRKIVFSFCFARRPCKVVTHAGAGFLYTLDDSHCKRLVDLKQLKTKPPLALPAWIDDK